MTDAADTAAPSLHAHLAGLEARAAAIRTAISEIHLELIAAPLDPELHARASALEQELASIAAQQSRLVTAKGAAEQAADLERRQATLNDLQAARARIVGRMDRQGGLVMDLVRALHSIAPLLAELQALEEDQSADGRALFRASSYHSKRDRQPLTLPSAVSQHVGAAVHASGLGTTWATPQNVTITSIEVRKGVSTGDAIDAHNAALLAEMDKALVHAAADLDLGPRPAKPNPEAFRRPVAPQVDHYGAALAAAGYGRTDAAKRPGTPPPTRPSTKGHTPAA